MDNLFLPQSKVIQFSESNMVLDLENKAIVVCTLHFPDTNSNLKEIIIDMKRCINIRQGMRVTFITFSAYTPKYVFTNFYYNNMPGVVGEPFWKASKSGRYSVIEFIALNDRDFYCVNTLGFNITQIV